MLPNIPPIPGSATEKAIPQAGSAMVVPAVEEIPGTSEENARQGGRIETKAFEATETRPQELHGAVEYQRQTADPGAVPKFFDYTELTKPRQTIRG